MMTRNKGLGRRIGAWAILAVLLAGEAGATSATWTNTASPVAYWTNAANWNAANYPGYGVNENASLTNPVASSYKAVADTTLPNTLGTVEVKNHGGGAAWVLVTNSVLSVTNLLVRTGGGIEIDNLGVVTNATVTMDGTNGQILVNSGGSLFSVTNLFVGNTAGGTNNSLTIGDHGTVASRLVIGNNGSSNNALWVTGNNAKIYNTNAVVVIGNYTAFNRAVFTGTNTVWDLGGQDFRIGAMGVGSGQSVSNSLMVSGGSLTLTNISVSLALFIGYAQSTGPASCNQLIVTNGGHLYTTKDVAVGAGATASSNVAIVTGANSLWDTGNYSSGVHIGGSTGGSPAGGSFNQLVVDQGGTMTNCCFRVGYNTPLSCGNSLIVTNGGRIYASAGSTLVGAWGTNNSTVVTGSNSLLNLGQQILYVGGSSTQTGALARVQIDSGGAVTNGYVRVGYNATTFGNTLVITNGGQLFTSGSSSYIGAASSSNSAVVDGTNSVWNCSNQTLIIGDTNNVGNQLAVANGGTLSNVNALIVGQYAGANSNTLTIASGGRVYAASVTAGSASAMTNRVLIGAGALLAANALTNGGVAAGNVISNAGGIFEFTTATPTVTPNGAGGIALAGGTISFSAVTNANVKGNWSGTQLTNMTFTGHNTFRLNTASNAAPPDQTYTFTTDLGPTNYARLELINGSQFRGGDLMIGNGGSLLVSNGVATVSNLILAAGSTLEMNVPGTNAPAHLVAQGTVTLGGALKVTLGAAPILGNRYVLMTKTSPGYSGSFDSVNATYQGTNYTMSVKSQGSNQMLGYYATGTVILFR